MKDNFLKALFKKEDSRKNSPVGPIETKINFSPRPLKIDKL